MAENAETTWTPKTSGNAFSAGGNDYKVFRYPEDIGSPKSPHYVLFYINVNTNSKITTGESKLPVATGRTAGVGASSNLPGGNILGVQLGAAQYKRSTHAIALYMPPGVTVNYGIQYDEMTPNVMGNMILGGMGNFTDAFQNGEMGVTALLKTLGGVAGEEMRHLSKKLIGATTGIDLEAVSGVVDNPRTESMYKSTQIRTHTFQFHFMPKTPEESYTICDIIDIFKINMHPEIKQDALMKSAYMITPNRFDIEFHGPSADARQIDGKTQENSMIHKIATCVLETLNVDYNTNGQWITFSGTNAPVSIGMSLTFKEIEPLNRDMVRQGF